MEETRPEILLKKYKSMFGAAMIVEVVSYVVSLTDSIVAANIVGLEAFSAISLVAPFLSVAFFLAAIINSGTLKNYSYELGRLEKKRAGEFFCQGVIMAIGVGIIMSVLMLIFKSYLYSTMSISPEILHYLNQYYNIIVFFFLFVPISSLLDNIVVSDGGERLSAVLNVLQIVGNVVLSFVLASIYGVVGIAMATVVCKVAFVLLILTWFLRKNRTVQFSWHFSLKDLLKIVQKGIVRASTYLTTALMLWIMNAYILNNYDTVTFNVWVIVQKIWGLSSIFLGLVMSVQSLVSILLGQNNTKAIRALGKELRKDLLIGGSICTVAVLLLTGWVLAIFHVSAGSVYDRGIVALRMVSPVLILLPQTIFLFMYYFMIEKNILSLTVGFLKDLICPVGIVMLLGFIMNGNSYAIWIGIVASQIVAIMMIACIVITIYKKGAFPFLLSKENDERIHIFAFNINIENIAKISETADEVLAKRGYDKRMRILIGICSEDILNFIREKNEADRKLMAECTLICEDGGVRLVILDDGKIRDFLEEDMLDYSFFQYIVARVVTLSEKPAYVTTMGLNRSECYFAKEV